MIGEEFWWLWGGGGLCVIWGSTLPWDLSQIYPCTPLPCFSGGYERRREWETFLGIISPGEWRLQGDQTLILMRRRPRIRSCSEAASNTLPGFYFISVMETQHSSLLFGSEDGSCRSEGLRGIHNENTVASFTITITPQYQNILMISDICILWTYTYIYKHMDTDSKFITFCWRIWSRKNIMFIDLVYTGSWEVMLVSIKPLWISILHFVRYSLCPLTSKSLRCFCFFLCVKSFLWYPTKVQALMQVQY